MSTSYESALEALIELITDDYTATTACELADKFDDGGVFDKRNATQTERQLWVAITELVDAAGEEAMIVVDDAISQSPFSCHDCDED